MTVEILAIAAISLGAAMWWFWPIARLTYSGIELDPKETYEFMFFASFQVEANAQQVAGLSFGPKMNTSISLSPNGNSYSVTWTLIEKANARKILRIKSDIEAAVATAGGQFLLFAASSVKKVNVN